MDFTFSISSSSVTEISSADNMTSLVSNIGVNVLVKNDGVWEYAYPLFNVPKKLY